MRPAVHRRRPGRLGCGALALALAGTGFVGTAEAAQAGPYCEPKTLFEIQDSRYVFLWDKKTFLRDGPGGTLHGSVTKASTISGTFGTKVESEANAIFAAVKAEVNASVTRSMTTTVGHVYDHVITPGRYGNAKYGTWGFQVKWQQIQVFSNCHYRLLRTGKARLPTVAVGFKYFETRR